MTTTHDDATTWRDLADQLTPQQIAEMEYCEREGIPPGLTSPQHQLNCARAMGASVMGCTGCGPLESTGGNNPTVGGSGTERGGTVGGFPLSLYTPSNTPPTNAWQ
jgi:hypothetical protein